MSATARLSLPYIAPQQAQKQVTYNEAMAALDQLVQPVVKSRTTTTPPASPAEGDCYIVAPAATGIWASKDNRFACFTNGGWSFRTATDGWLAFVIDAAELAVFRSGAWATFTGVGGTGLAKLGVHANADLTNRLSVAADGSLFSHDGTSHRMSLNKASAADTASLLFNDNTSGRAEIGLTADDALHVKVSPNGSSWIEALNIAQASGLVTLPAGQLAFPAVQNPSANVNVLDDYEEGTFTPTFLFGGSAVGVTYGSATLGRYTKIGRLVTVSVMVTLTSKGTSTGQAQIGGLPFVSLNDSLFGGVAVGWAAQLSSVAGSVTGLIQPNSTRLNFYASNAGAPTALTNTNFTNTTAIYATATYEVQ